VELKKNIKKSPGSLVSVPERLVPRKLELAGTSAGKESALALGWFLLG